MLSIAIAMGSRAAKFIRNVVTSIPHTQIAARVVHAPTTNVSAVMPSLVNGTMKGVRAVGALGKLTSYHPSLPPSLPAFSPALLAPRRFLPPQSFIGPSSITSVPLHGGVDVGAYLGGSRNPATPTRTVAPLPDPMGEADVDVLA